MNDFLLGVIVGGIITSIYPIASLIVNYFKWRESMIKITDSDTDEDLFDDIEIK